MALYLKLDNLQGDVTHKQFKGTSAISAMHLPGIHNGITNQVGNSNYHRGSAPQFALIQIIKPIDSITPNLFMASCMGTVFKEVTISDVGPHSDDAITPFLVTTLKNVRIASYSRVHDEEGQHPRELLSLSYSSLTERFTGKNANGSQQTSKSAGFDLETIRSL
jgi:type VI protein secretion system component Hcp